MKCIAAFVLFVAAASAFDSCEVCENVLAPILRKATPADRERVTDILKGLCFGNAACIAKVDSIRSDVTKATPEILCSLVDLCKKADKRSFLDVCGLCEQGVDTIKAHLSDETAESIKSKLEVLCFGNAACIAKIESVVDEIAQASSQEVCSDMHLCSSYKMFTFTGDRICHLCERVAEKLLSNINNQTLDHLEDYLNTACRGNSQCLDAVAKMIAEVASLTPESVCQSVHLCAGQDVFVADVQATDKCSACKQKLNDVLSDANLVKIEATLKKICHGNTECTTAVDDLISKLKANRGVYVDNLCKFSKQC
jgi:hypothetical protein